MFEVVGYITNQLSMNAKHINLNLVCWT